MARKGKNQECVAIAKDVLRQLETGKYIAQRGDYLMHVISADTYDHPAFDDNILRAKGDLQSALKIIKPICRVCAVGSMFISAVRKFDGFNSNGYWYDEAMKRILRRFFTSAEVRNIEEAFEFREHGEHSDTRLRRIMKFIIKNNGNFDHKQFAAS